MNFSKKPRNIDIVIPVFNEEDNIHDVLSTITSTLREYPQFQFQILLVNDGSTDNTSLEVANYLTRHYDIQHPIFLIENEENIGTAKTMLRLFQIAVSNKPVLVVKLDMDHDFSHQEVIRKFFDTIIKTKWGIESTILTGIRIIPNEKKMTFYEQARKKKTDIYLKEKLGLENYDPVSGGTQLYPLPILKELLAQQVVQDYELRWGVDVMLPLLARKRGYQLQIIPIYNSQYSFDRRSDSKVKLQYDAFTAVFERVHNSSL